MNWFGGILIIERPGHTTTIQNVSFARAQELLNNDFAINGPFLSAMYHPYATSMAAE